MNENNTNDPRPDNPEPFKPTAPDREKPAGEARPAPVAAPPPLEPPLPERLDARVLFESLLRQPGALARRLGETDHNATARLVALALGSAAVFGLVLGTFAMHEQLWAAPLKIVLGMLVSALICFPSLYIFGLLAGARASAGHLAAVFAGAMALAGLLLLGFAPAVWIFTQSTDSLGFMGFLALAAWAVSLGFGIGFLFRALFVAGARRRGPIFVWSVIFVMVTLQMTTSLRPILGRSDHFLTTEKRFFLQHWSETAGESLAPENTGKSAGRRGADPRRMRGEERKDSRPDDAQPSNQPRNSR